MHLYYLSDGNSFGGMSPTSLRHWAMASLVVTASAVTIGFVQQSDVKQNEHGCFLPSAEQCAEFASSLTNSEVKSIKQEGCNRQANDCEYFLPRRNCS